MAHSSNRLGYFRLYLTTLAVLAADQLSKLWIFKQLEMDTGQIVVIEGFFQIVHVGNEGAAWGIFSGQGKALILLALVALSAIYCFRQTLQLHRYSMQWLFGLICGGILGNTIDRMVHGHVIDFLDFRLPFSIPMLVPDGRYPAFNIADCGIVIGVISYITLSFIQPVEKNRENLSDSR